MSIKTLTIKNFTVFKDLQIDTSANVNVFVGENGTGKTHLLKAIYAACLLSCNQNRIPNALVKCFQEKQSEANLLHDKEILKLNISIVPQGIKRKHTLSTTVIPTDFEDLQKYNLNAKQTFETSYIVEVPRDEKFLATYIPVKDMLTHSNGFLAMADKYQNFPFDKTLTDIVTQASRWKVKKIPNIAVSILPILEEMIDGQVVFENEEFFVMKKDGHKINFAVEAEGLKKIGLLWQLLMTESITENSILIWDEPEANLNPKFLSKLVDCLITLSRNGVQIFLSTHNYILAKYFDVLKNDNDTVLFHSLYLKNKTTGVKCESKKFFAELQRNDIADAFNQLLERIYKIKTGN